MWLILLAIAISTAIYFGLIRPHNYWKENGVPFSKPMFLFGSIGANILRKRSFAHMWQDIYNEYPNERYVGFYMFLSPGLMLRDPDLIKTITIKEFDCFTDHVSVLPEDADPLWNSSLSVMRGEKWREMRGKLSPVFTGSKMRIIFSLISDASKKFVDHYSKSNGLVKLEMKDSFTRLANDVIASTAFGVSCDSLEDKDNEFYRNGKSIVDFRGLKSLKFFLIALSPTLMKFLKIKIFEGKLGNYFRNVVKETIKHREETKTVRPDMIHLLLEARKGKLEVAEDISAPGSVAGEKNVNDKTKKQIKLQITDDDITAQALLFFFAGFETVSGLMCLLSYELALNPDVQERLREEVDETLAKCEGKITYDALKSMKYMEMVVSETLRKWPPAVSSDRKCVKPFTIKPQKPGEKPIHLKTDSVVVLPIYALHRDPKLFPNPDTFDPERFSDENRNQIAPFSYIPFGAGPRNCIGSRFALLETKTIIFYILTKFNIIPIEETEVPLVLSKKNINLMSDSGFWLGLRPRKDTLN